MRKACTGFTLIELLTVIAVMTILMTLSVRGLRNDLSIQLSHAGDQVSQLAHQAKQLAKTHRSLTALFVVTNSGDPEKDYRLMGILEILPGDNQWRMVSRWETLPEGIKIDPDRSEAFDQSPAPKVAFSVLKRGTQTIPASNYICQIFLPSGELLQSSPAPSIYLHLAHGQGDDFFRVVFSNTTGNAFIERPGGSGS